MIARIGSTSGWTDNFTVGASAVEPNRLVYFELDDDNIATGVVQHARGNAVTTARGIAGVSVGRAVSGALALVQRTGPVRVLADSVCAPTLFGPAYLSSEAGGKVASSINGAVYPRLLGQFLEAAVAADGTVVIMPSFDDLRDDDREWLIDDYRPTVDANTRDVAVNAALWRSFRFEGKRCNKVGAGSWILRLDGVLLDNSGFGWSHGYTGHAAKTWQLAGGDTNHVRSAFEATITVEDTQTRTYWAGSGMVSAEIGSGVVNVVPATSIGIGWTGTAGFEANISHLRCFARVALP